MIHDMEQLHNLSAQASRASMPWQADSGSIQAFQGRVDAVERRMVTRQGNPRSRPSFGPLVHGSTVHWDAPKEILRLADLRHH